MADIVGVVFRNGIKIYHFDPAGIELNRGDRVVVQTSSGPEIGQVVEPTHTVEDSELPAPLKKVVRVATDKDLESQAASEVLRRQAMDTCRELIDQHGLDMKLVDADIGFGGEKITFSFTSEERVDFRALVGDLAKTLKLRIELRQVGAREEARMVGGLGPCGRGLCCTMFPGDDDPVSIRMAKEQNLPLNPMKISGLCGRLMCCLKYEQEQYVRFRKEAPPKGTPVCTLSGQGVVCGYNCTKEAVTVRLEEGGMTEVRLCACQTQEDGSLLVIPEEPVEEPMAPVSWFDSPAGIRRLVDDDEGPDSLPVVQAEVILGENGEPVEVIVAETSRRGRGRRGRGRRRGRGKDEGGEAAAAGGPSGTAAAGGGSRGADGARPAPRPRRGGHERAGQPAAAGPSGERAAGEAGPGSAPSTGEPGTPGTSSRSRRRRRPRQPGGGGANGTPGAPGGAPGGGAD